MMQHLLRKARQIGRVARGQSVDGSSEVLSRHAVVAFLNSITAEVDIEVCSAHGTTWLVLPNGLRFKYVDAYNSISRILFSEGSFEQREMALVLGNLTAHSVFFDVGANAGLYSLCVRLARPNAIIHAFEPVPAVADLFLENWAANEFDAREIHLNRVVVSDRVGASRMTADWHSSNYVTDEGSTQPTVDVPMTSLDSYVEDAGIERVDFIKIDVEGHELHVLEGARKLLSRFSPILLVELLETPQQFGDRQVDDYRRVLEFMGNLGFAWHVIDDDGRVVAQGELGEGSFRNSYHNYLFHHSDARAPVV